MNRSLAFAALSLALAIVPQVADCAVSANLADMPAGIYVIDRTHASVTAKLTHMGFSSYTFRFLRFDGSYTFDPANPAASKLKVTIDPASIDTVTGDDAFGKTFDAELAGDGWLETGKFPTASFVSTAIDVGDGHKGKVAGDLTLHGVTKSIVVTMDMTGTGQGMQGETRIGFQTSFTVHREDYDMNTMPGAAGDDVKIMVALEAIKQ